MNNSAELQNIAFIVQNMKVSDIGRPKEMSQQVYQHMAEMTLLVTQLVVECAKKMPGFIDLDKDDQITLLKVSLPVSYSCCLYRSSSLFAESKYMCLKI